MTNFTVIAIFAVIALIIFYFISKSDSSIEESNLLNEEDIDKINLGLQDITSDFYEEMPSGRRIRYETIIDLILMNLDSNNKKAILDNEVNLNSALQIIAYASASSPNDSSFREKQIDRIENERSYVFPELGRDKCPPPPPPPASEAELLSAPYWVWTLNRVLNHILGYRTEVRGFLNDTYEIQARVKNKFYTQFDQPEQLNEEISKFTWQVNLFDNMSDEVIAFKHTVYFQN